MKNEQWLWRGALGLIVLALAGGLVLTVALALGWNNPGPDRPPDWQAFDLPLCLEAAPGETRVSLLGYLGSDFVLEVEAAPLSGPDFDAYGLVYRAQDAAHYYGFVVGSDGYYAILRVAGDKETELASWQQFPHVHRGRQVNRLRVTCVGATCRFYINDEYAATVKDNTWSAGDVGLWVRGVGDGDTAVQFLNARTWSERNQPARTGRAHSSAAPADRVGNPIYHSDQILPLDLPWEQEFGYRFTPVL